jgi:predicted membrane-bound dolichyl-phosphate-mannose-protein mannosyltransferase
MGQLYAIVGAYGIGAWIAAMIVAFRWLLNERTRIATFLTIAGWAAVATIGAAIVAASA